VASAAKGIKTVMKSTAEYAAFVDAVLSVSCEEMQRREPAYRAQVDANPTPFEMKPVTSSKVGQCQGILNGAQCQDTGIPNSGSEV
jgi:hypothetical protein